MTMASFLRSLSAALIVTAALAGCAASEDRTGNFFVAPGKYVLYTCPEMVQRQREIVNRQRDLEGLIAKASKDSAGRLVSALAYDAEYSGTKADLRVLRQQAVEKQCELPDPNAPPPPAAPPAAKPPAPKPKR